MDLVKDQTSNLATEVRNCLVSLALFKQTESLFIRRDYCAHKQEDDEKAEEAREGENEHADILSRYDSSDIAGVSPDKQT
jgi:hypothetical protein